MLYNGKGDCVEHQLLFLYLMNINFGTEGYLVTVPSLIEGADWEHALAEVDGIYYDCTCNKTVKNPDVQRRWSYETALFLAYNYY